MRFLLNPGLPGVNPPPRIPCAGKSIPVIGLSLDGSVLELDLGQEGVVNTPLVLKTLESLLGVSVSVLAGSREPKLMITPVVQGSNSSTQPPKVAHVPDVMVEILASEEKALPRPVVKQPGAGSRPVVKEPKSLPRPVVKEPEVAPILATVTPIELGRTPPNSPAFGSMMLWDRLMRKPPPTKDWSDWVNHPEYPLYIFLPNDLAKGEANSESTLTNGYYMQVALAVYQGMCARAKFYPEVVLTNGDIRKVADLTPLDNVQPGVIGGTAAKLCNSKLASGYDDSPYRGHLLMSLKSLNPDDYENPQVYHSVSARMENIIKGVRDSLTNAEIARRLFDNVEGAIADRESIVYTKTSLLTTVIGVLNALRDEGYVLQESSEVFKRRLYVAGASAHADFLYDMFVLASEVDPGSEIDYD